MIDEISMKIHADKLIRMALAEDVTGEDVSTGVRAARVRARHGGPVGKAERRDGGAAVFARAFQLLDEAVEVKCFAADGDRVQEGQLLATVTGDMRAILTAERTALNFLQRMKRHRDRNGAHVRAARGEPAAPGRYAQDHAQHAPV